MHMKKLILALLILTTIVCIVSCGEVTPPIDTPAVTDANGNTPAVTTDAQGNTPAVTTDASGEVTEDPVVVKPDYVVKKLTVGGVDISEFVIVLGPNMTANERHLATVLQKKIYEVCKVEVPCVDYKQPEQKYEILFGMTGRKASEMSPMYGKGSGRQTEDKLAFIGNGTDGNGSMMRYLQFLLDAIPAGESYDIKITDFDNKAMLQPHLTETNMPAGLSDNTSAYDADFYADARNVLEKFEYSIGQLYDEITVLDPYEADSFTMLSQNKIFVATNGNDNNPGTIDAPLATIAAAANKIGVKGGIIYVRGGDYDTTNMGIITAKGTLFSPLFIMPYQDEKVTLSAGKQISSSLFKPLDPADEVGARIPESVQANVVYVNVFELGWTAEDLGAISEESLPALYINNTTGVMARYPNEGEDLLYFTKALETGSVSLTTSGLYNGWIKRVKNWSAWKNAGATDNVVYDFDKSVYKDFKEALADAKKLNEVADTAYTDSNGNLNLDMGWSIKMVDLTPFKQKWVNTGDMWYYGNTYSGWKYITAQITFDKSKTAIVSMHGTQHGTEPSGNSPTGYNNYYLFNIIEALDVPGEWYLDKTTGNLYVYKTDDFDGGVVTYCAKKANILHFKECSNVILDGFTIKFGGAYGICMTKCDNVVIQRCTISQTDDRGIHFDNSNSCATIYNELFDTGSYPIGVYVMSTNKKKCDLTRHVIQNNYIHSPRYSERYGINAAGLQTVVSHNYLVDCGIVFGSQGFDCVVEYNEVNGGSLDVMDCGLIYIGGLGSYGNHVRYNYLYNWNACNSGVYFDSMTSFNYGYYNMIDTTEAENQSFVRFLYSSTGHYNVFFGNICVGRPTDKIMESCLFFDDAASAGHTFNSLLQNFVNDTDAFTSASFASHFPEVVNYRNLAKQYLTAITQPGYQRDEFEIYLRSPGGNYIANNIVLGSDISIDSALKNKKDSATGEIVKITTITENNFISKDPASVLKDYANGDFTVLPEALNTVTQSAPAFKQLSTADTGLTYER